MLKRYRSKPAHNLHQAILAYITNPSFNPLGKVIAALKNCTHQDLIEQSCNGFTHFMDALSLPYKPDIYKGPETAYTQAINLIDSLVSYSNENSLKFFLTTQNNYGYTPLIQAANSHNIFLFNRINKLLKSTLTNEEYSTELSKLDNNPILRTTIPINNILVDEKLSLTTQRKLREKGSQEDSLKAQKLSKRQVTISPKRQQGYLDQKADDSKTQTQNDQLSSISKERVVIFQKEKSYPNSTQPVRTVFLEKKEQLGNPPIEERKRKERPNNYSPSHYITENKKSSKQRRVKSPSLRTKNTTSPFYNSHIVGGHNKEPSFK